MTGLPPVTVIAALSRPWRAPEVLAAFERHNYCYDRSVPGPRVQEAGPAISRRALSGDGVSSDYHGRVPHSVVDDPRAVPLRIVPPPTSAEILRDVRAA